MTDKNICEVAYFLNLEEIGLIANATDSFFEEKPDSSFQVQISDLDVEIPDEQIEANAGFVALDVGGIAVNEVTKNILVTLGCHDDLFRKMTVNGKHNVLWQVNAPGTYFLLNEELDAAIDASVYRGPLDEVPLELSEKSKSLVGCMIGREDYQEVVFSKELYVGLCTQCDVSEYFIGIPLYSSDLINVVNGNFDLVPSDTYEKCGSNYFDMLRSKELLALLRYASAKSIATIGNETYKRLKSLKLPLEVKKEALKLHKSL
mgnify:CR=1 FL=1